MGTKYLQDSVTPDRDLITLNLGSLALLIVGAILLWRGVEFSHRDSIAASTGGITPS